MCNAHAHYESSVLYACCSACDWDLLKFVVAFLSAYTFAFMGLIFVLFCVFFWSVNKSNYLIMVE